MSSTPASETTREGLIRAVRRWDLVALTVNGVIGAGIFGLPAEAFRRLGVYSLPAFVFCGFAVALITLCFAEVSSRFRQTGGPYLYARAAFGPLVGFQVGWATWVTRVTGYAANVNALVDYLGFLLPAAQSGVGRALVITAITLGLTAVNVVGVRDTTKVGNILTFAKLTPLAIFVVVGVFYIRPEAFASPVAPAFDQFSSGILLLLYAFVGFEMTAIPAGEMRNPEKDQPSGLMIAMAFIVAVYLVVQTVAIGTLPGLAESTRPLADAAAAFMGPFGGGLIAIGAVVSVLGNLTVVTLVASRLLFAMGERREIPAWTGSVHPSFRTPHFAIYATMAVMLALSLSGTFVYLATISMVVRLFVYAATCAAVPVLRRFPQKAAPAGFLIPGGQVVAVLALLLIVWLLLQTQLGEARDTGIAILIGFVLYFLARRRT